MTRPQKSSHPLPNGITRDVLERDGLRTALAEVHPDVAMVSDAGMRESIQETLSAAPSTAAVQHEGVWIFGYGSLLWNPCVPVAEWRGALLYGFHRDFRIRLTHGRGSPEAPGLMLGLVPGGSCRGMGLRIPPVDLEYELLMVWRREMLTGVYTPRWVTLHTDRGRLPAITFTVNVEHASFCGRLPDTTVVEMLATGGGLIGSSLDYLNNTVDHLDQQGIHDRRLRDLRRRVNAAIEKR